MCAAERVGCSIDDLSNRPCSPARHIPAKMSKPTTVDSSFCLSCDSILSSSFGPGKLNSDLLTRALSSTQELTCFPTSRAKTVFSFWLLRSPSRSTARLPARKMKRKPNRMHQDSSFNLTTWQPLPSSSARTRLSLGGFSSSKWTRASSSVTCTTRFTTRTASGDSWSVP